MTDNVSTCIKKQQIILVTNKRDFLVELCLPNIEFEEGKLKRKMNKKELSKPEKIIPPKLYLFLN